MNNGNALWIVMKREVRQWASRRIYLFMMVIAPLGCWLFFADLMKEGVPTDLPAALVDKDGTSTSRALARSLDAFELTKITLRTTNFGEAREAMQRGEIYGIFYIPENFKRDASSGRQPVISFYTNDAYILPGSLIFKDMRMQAALANGVVQRTLLQAKGGTDPVLSAQLNPVVVDTHPLYNPWLSYAVYLTNILVPAFLSMFVMFTACFSIGEELKRGTAAEWMQLSRNSVTVAVIGKLAPQLLIFLIMGTFYLVLLYRFLHFPLNSGFFPMFLAMLLLVLASQAFALFATGLYSRNRLALSSCALWGVLSFSITGFTYPVRSMPEVMQVFSHVFPMRHYFLIYVDQALNGIPLVYSWQPYLSLSLFLILPVAVMPKLKKLLLRNEYLP